MSLVLEARTVVAVKVVASPEAVQFICGRGGLLFVWADHADCCTGRLTYLEASIESPGSDHEFVRLSGDGAGFQLLFDPGGHGMPEEVHLDLRGRSRKRVRASWNGCSYAIEQHRSTGD